MNMAIVQLTRRATFSASHRLWSESLSEKENQEIFGKCTHIHGHGHNYVLEVTLQGKVDPKSGVVFSLSDLKEIIERAVLRKVDHKHLNLDVAEFKSLVPTAENIAVVIWGWLSKELPKGLLHEVLLRETENNIAIYRGD